MGGGQYDTSTNYALSFLPTEDNYEGLLTIGMQVRNTTTTTTTTSLFSINILNRCY